MSRDTKIPGPSIMRFQLTEAQANVIADEHAKTELKRGITII